MNSPLPPAEKLLATNVLGRTFCSTNPFGWPFASALNLGRVLFPTDGCHLSADQFNSLAQAAAQRGQKHCYLVVVEGRQSLQVECDEPIFLVDLSDFESYANLHLTLENALYARDGSWGLMVSHEMHAVLGGDAAFISEFNQRDTRGEEQWRDFQTQWSSERDADWVSEIASHVLNRADTVGE